MEQGDGVREVNKTPFLLIYCILFSYLVIYLYIHSFICLIYSLVYFSFFGGGGA